MVLHAIAKLKIPAIEVKVALGGDSSERRNLAVLTDTYAGVVSLTYNAGNMPELMAWADVAISSAGSTVWELCFMGLPAFLIDLVPHQRLVADTLQQRGAGIHIGCSKTLNPKMLAEKLDWVLASSEIRARMSQHGRELVDGRGAERVVAAMLHGTLRLRQVDQGDCRLLWEWINDPLVRASSFSSENIPWDEHCEWLSSRLVDPHALLYLATDEGDIPVGHVRYRIEGTRAVISIDMGPQFRGRGLGSHALELALKELDRHFGHLSSRLCKARCQPDNQASMRLFANANFELRGTEAVRNQPANHFVLEKAIS